MANVVSSVRVRYEDLRTLNFAAISPAYAAVGTPFENPVRILKVTNLTNGNLLISFNAVDDMDIVAAGGFYLYDFTSNKSDAGGLFEQPAQDRLYVRNPGVAATSGDVYVTVIFASQV